MSKLKAVTVLITLTVVLPTLAFGDFGYPKLPWYEKYFFPVGAWSYPYYECVPDSDYVVDLVNPKHQSRHYVVQLERALQRHKLRRVP
jgi:hypothetical protein